MSSASPFTLTRASVADMPEIARLMYRCFPPFVREVIMGCLSEADLPRWIGFLEDECRTHHHAVWIKVVDKASGRIVAAALWKVFANAGMPPTAEDQIVGWLDDARRAQAEHVVGAMVKGRKEALPGGFVHLNMCFTSPDYRRQGAGSLMMQWGCDLADVLALPAWIEASSAGNALYQIYGFVDVDTPPGLGEVTFMQREPKSMNREGGHIKV